MISIRARTTSSNSHTRPAGVSAVMNARKVRLDHVDFTSLRVDMGVKLFVVVLVLSLGNLVSLARDNSLIVALVASLVLLLKGIGIWTLAYLVLVEFPLAILSRTSFWPAAKVSQPGGAHATTGNPGNRGKAL